MSSLAHTHAEEFLDESKDWQSANPRTQRLLLQRARGIVMECSRALQPPSAPIGAAATAEPLDFGLSLARDPIFETSTDEPQWASGMLAAIATAKRMGATNFEIQVVAAPSSIDKSGRAYGLGLNEMMWQQMYGGQQEPWQSSRGSYFKITIFAVRIK